MRLVVGLGNPGGKYEGTRHNVGFDFIDYLAREHGVSLAAKWQARVAKARLWEHRVVLAKPETFMNNSGLAVGRISAYFHIPPEDVVVVHDDLDLELARLKLVMNRGPGGHNGVSSIISHLGGRNFARFRFGIGRPPAGMPASRYVLARFAAAERLEVDEAMPRLAAALKILLDEGAAKAMNLVNTGR